MFGRISNGSSSIFIQAFLLRAACEELIEYILRIRNEYELVGLMVFVM